MSTETKEFNSSAIRRATYNRKQLTLKISFTDGDVRTYHGVGQQEWEGLKNASSAGQYFNANIRPSYTEG